MTYSKSKTYLLGFCIAACLYVLSDIGGWFSQTVCVLISGYMSLNHFLQMTSRAAAVGFIAINVVVRLLGAWITAVVLAKVADKRGFLTSGYFNTICVALGVWALVIIPALLQTDKGLISAGIYVFAVRGFGVHLIRNSIRFDIERSVMNREILTSKKSTICQQATNLSGPNAQKLDDNQLERTGQLSFFDYEDSKNIELCHRCGARLMAIEVFCGNCGATRARVSTKRSPDFSAMTLSEFSTKFIYTPRGLKVLVPVDYAFALMSKLYPQINAFKVLQRTESIQNIPAMLAFISAIACFVKGVGTSTIAGVVFMTYILSFLVTFSGTYLPLLTGLSKFFGYITVWGLSIAFLLIAGFIFGGLPYVAAYLAGQLPAALLSLIVEMVISNRNYKKTKIFIGRAEKNFYTAYFSYAKSLGLSSTISITEEDLTGGEWLDCYIDLATEYPQIVRRFR